MILLQGPASDPALNSAPPFFGQTLHLPPMDVGQPLQRSGRANPRVLGLTVILQRLNVGAIQSDAFPQLPSQAH